jgi:hypothetical protein
MRGFRIGLILVALAALGAGVAAAPPREHKSPKPMQTLWRLYPLGPKGTTQQARPRPRPVATTPAALPQPAHGNGGPSAELVGALVAGGVALGAVGAAFAVRVRRRRTTLDRVRAAAPARERLDEALHELIPRPRPAPPAAKPQAGVAPPVRPAKDGAAAKPKPPSKPSKPPKPALGSKPLKATTARKLAGPPSDKPDVAARGKAALPGPKPSSGAPKKEHTNVRHHPTGTVGTRTATTERKSTHEEEEARAEDRA